MSVHLRFHNVAWKGERAGMQPLEDAMLRSGLVKACRLYYNYAEDTSFAAGDSLLTRLDAVRRVEHVELSSTEFR